MIDKPMKSLIIRVSCSKLFCCWGAEPRYPLGVDFHRCLPCSLENEYVMSRWMGNKADLAEFFQVSAPTVDDWVGGIVQS